MFPKGNFLRDTTREPRQEAVTRKLTPITAEDCDKAKYPDTCPRCGKPAWIGKVIDTVYCSNHKCEHFEGRLGR